LLEESIALNFGENQIVNELKFRNIGQYNINLALKEISNEIFRHFDKIALQVGTASKKLIFKKRKKFCDYLLRKGFESNLIYDKERTRATVKHSPHYLQNLLH
jgi:regulatory protein